MRDYLDQKLFVGKRWYQFFCKTLRFKTFILTKWNILPTVDYKNYKKLTWKLI